MFSDMRELLAPQAASADAAPERSRVLRKQTDLLVKQSRTALVVALGASALLGVPMIWSRGAAAFAAWLALLVAVFWARQRLLERARDGGSLPDVLRIAMIGAALLGLVMTLPAALQLPVVDEVSRAFLTMWHLAWMAAALAVLGVFPPGYKVYLACSMVNVALGWWLSARHMQAALLSLGLIGAWVVLSRLADRIGRLIEESTQFRSEREQLVQRLQQALAASEAAQKSRSRFLASASHDLLQPVHALLLLASMSRDLPEGPRRDDVLRQLQATAESIDSMFRGLLDLARFDAGTLQPQLTSMPVAHVLRAVQAGYQTRCADKGVLLTVASPPGVYVHADPAMFDRIVRNLVDNAVKFTPRGTIAVRCAVAGDSVIIEVQDSGVGIAAADLAHVQEPFYRGASARQVEADGVGLGLANSTQMAHLLHGDISISSAPDQGTTVRLSLPVGHGPRDSSGGVPRRRELRYRCVVLVEDDRTARNATDLWLQEHGAIVVATADATSAIEQCRARGLTPDYLLCDYKLGETATGVQAIAALRAAFGPLPAAIVSGETLRAGVVPPDVPLLAKPLRAERLEQLLG